MSKNDLAEIDIIVATIEKALEAVRELSSGSNKSEMALVPRERAQKEAQKVCSYYGYVPSDRTVEKLIRVYQDTHRTAVYAFR